MQSLFVAVVAIVVGLAYGNDGIQPNEEWKKINEVIKVLDTLFDNLALTVEDASNQQKRAFSIILAGAFIYVSQGENSTVNVDISQPADVIASDIRTTISLFRVVLDPVMNIVKRVCTPEVTADQCSEALAKEKQCQIATCEGFTEHIKFLDETVEVVTNPVYRSWFKKVWAVSATADDQTALDFVDKITSGNADKEVFSILLKWYSEFAGGHFPCNLPSVSCDSSNCF